ncbi:hypothetical protein EJB05_54184, partial [Eragrostis curvula]
MAHPRLCLLMLLSSAVSAVGGGDEFIYCGFSGSNLTMDGESTVTADGLLQLTSGLPNLKGHAFYPSPLKLRNPVGFSVPSFSTTFVFSIMGTYIDLSSHGLAFVLSPSKNFSNQNNGNATNHLLAVELDTVLNVEFYDINQNHVGIDVNSLTSAESFSPGYYDSYGLFRNMSLSSGQPIQVWVDYDSNSTTLDVTIAPCCFSYIKPRLPERGRSDGRSRRSPASLPASIAGGRSSCTAEVRGSSMS